MKKFITVHGHFYQPPRENPWTGEVDVEESAKPYHDWNERISKECYEANTHAPILSAESEVLVRLNNFATMSFDIGPTLLSWMRRKDPETYWKIIEADRESAQNHGGHGNAMAQIYNHLIMPLAPKRDKITQVIWGIRDFEFHYGRKPEGMWLSEAAVDHETLNILADQGILFTVLAPSQARRVRHVGFGSAWSATRHEGIDTRQPYRIILEKGKQFHIFFYDAAIARDVAFNRILDSGDGLAQRLLNSFGRRNSEQLVSTATDGESFGHHHKFGEMALAYAIKKIEETNQAVFTNYADFLDRFGSFSEVDIHENSSWSCCHGVERWRADCGCRLNFSPGWNQRWRAVLREAFDFLRDIVDGVFERELSVYFKNPWEARNDYISVMLDTTDASRNNFLSRHLSRPISFQDAVKIWDLMEAQKFMLFSYTSCAWFFDDISGIEPVHMMKFALRAMEYVQPYQRKDIEKNFLHILAGAKSNVPAMGTGKDVFNRFVKTAKPAAVYSMERK